MEGRPLDDAELTRRAKEGDADAYAQLVRAYQTIAVRVAHVVCGDARDAEDAAQDGFVKAFNALDRHRDGAQFRPWVLQIVANEAKNRRRSAGRRARYELTLIEDRASSEAAPSPEVAILAAESRRSLLDAVTGLPERQREVIACRYFVGLSENETAKVLGIRGHGQVACGAGHGSSAHVRAHLPEGAADA